MAVYKREGGAWSEQGVMRVREGGAWTAVGDGGYARVGSEWVNFQPLAGDLNPPESLVIVPLDLSASATWVNPEQDAGNDVTHVQVRLPETTSVWTELPYPATAITFNYLAPETEYQLQIRYIIREDGAITKQSTITEGFFTTEALSGPGTPAADPGGTGPDSIVLWPDIGGTVGSGCWWEYHIQTATTPASGAISWADATTLQQIDGNIGTENIDYVNDLGLACGQLARYKYRENCDGIAGDWEYRDPFVIVCDWGVDCGGIADSPQFNLSVYADAIVAAPELCGTVIRDAITTTIEWGKLPGFGSIQTATDNHTVFGLSTNGTLGVPTLAAKYGALVLLEDGDDFSATMSVNLDEVPGGSGGGSGTAPASFPAVRFGRNVALSLVFATTSTYYARATWIDANGTFRTLTGTTAMALDTFNTISLTMDANGTKTLYVNAVADATDTNTTAMAFSGAGIGQDVEVYTNQFMRIESIGAWDRVLTANELNLLYTESVSPFVVDWNYVELAGGTTTHNIAVLDADLQADDLILVGFRGGEGDTADTTPTGWTTAGFTEIESDRWSSFAYKKATGSETGNLTYESGTNSGASGLTGMFTAVVRNVYWGGNGDDVATGFYPLWLTGSGSENAVTAVCHQQDTGSGGQGTSSGAATDAGHITVFDPFKQNLPVGTKALAFTITTDAETHAGPGTAGAAEIPASAMTVDNITRSNSNCSMVEVNELEDVVTGTVTDLDVEWTTSGWWNQFWIVLHAPQAATFADTPQLVRVYVKDTQEVSIGIDIPHDIEDGDFVVATTTLSTATLTGTDGMTLVSEDLRVGSSYDYILAKSYLESADGAADGTTDWAITATTAPGTGSRRQIIFIFKGGTSVAAEGWDYTSNSTAGPDFPVTPPTAAYSADDLVLVNGWATGIVASVDLEYDGANQSMDDPPYQREMSGGPTPNEYNVWTKRRVTAGGTQTCPVFQKTDLSNFFDRSCYVFTVS